MQEIPQTKRSNDLPESVRSRRGVTQMGTLRRQMDPVNENEARVSRPQLEVEEGLPSTLRSPAMERVKLPQAEGGRARKEAMMKNNERMRQALADRRAAQVAEDAGVTTLLRKEMEDWEQGQAHAEAGAAEELRQRRVAKNMERQVAKYPNLAKDVERRKSAMMQSEMRNLGAEAVPGIDAQRQNDREAAREREMEEAISRAEEQGRVILEAIGSRGKYDRKALTELTEKVGLTIRDFEDYVQRLSWLEDSKVESGRNKVYALNMLEGNGRVSVRGQEVEKLLSYMERTAGYQKEAGVIAATLIMAAKQQQAENRKRSREVTSRETATREAKEIQKEIADLEKMIAMPPETVDAPTRRRMKTMEVESHELLPDAIPSEVAPTLEFEPQTRRYTKAREKTDTPRSAAYRQLRELDKQKTKLEGELAVLEQDFKAMMDKRSALEKVGGWLKKVLGTSDADFSDIHQEQIRKTRQQIADLDAEMSAFRDRAEGRNPMSDVELKPMPTIELEPDTEPMLDIEPSTERKGANPERVRMDREARAVLGNAGVDELTRELDWNHESISERAQTGRKDAQEAWKELEMLEYSPERYALLTAQLFNAVQRVTKEGKNIHDDREVRELRDEIESVNHIFQRMGIPGNPAEKFFVFSEPEVDQEAVTVRTKPYTKKRPAVSTAGKNYPEFKEAA